MKKEEAIERLKLFIGKADKLNNSDFIKKVLAGSGVKLSMGIDKPTVIERTGPGETEIDAFVLTFRFFIQNNESISLNNFSDLFNSSLIEPDEKTQFDQTRKSLNDFLDGNTMFNINGMITRREVMNVVIYGGLAHANKDKKKIYDEWMGNKIIAQFILNEFVRIITTTLDGIVYLRDLSETILKRINT